MTLFKYPGGKSYLTKWIISHFPSNYEDMTYVEGCLGGGNVLYSKRPSIQEIGCETNYGVYLVHFCLRYDAFLNRLRRTEYNEDTFNKSKQEYVEVFDIAWAEFCKRRMSRTGLGEDYSWSNRLRGGKPENLNAWQNALKNLDKFKERSSNVRFYNESIFKILPNYDSEDTLIYLDPPYVHETRKSQREYGPHEWKVADHRKMGRLVKKSKSKIIISGYESDLYKELFDGWRVEKKEMPNHSGQNKKKQKRTECLWLNY